MRKLIVSEFVTLDGVMQAPGDKDEDRDGGFEHGGWTLPYWHDDLGKSFLALIKGVDALLLGRRTYVVHAAAFEPMAAGIPFGDAMNSPKKYVASRTLECATEIEEPDGNNNNGEQGDGEHSTDGQPSSGDPNLCDQGDRSNKGWGVGRARVMAAR